MWNRIFDLLDTHTARIVQVLGMFTITVVVVFALIDRANVNEDNRRLIRDGLVERSAASEERAKLIDGQTELRVRIRELREQNERIVEFLQSSGINIPSSVLRGTTVRVSTDSDDSDDSDNDDTPDDRSSSVPSNTPTTPTNPTSSPNGDILGDVQDQVDDLTGRVDGLVGGLMP